MRRKKNWWHKMGKEIYENPTKLLITADGGGSNGRRNKLWKRQLQEFADKINMEIHMCHFPPGTSKWNKIEHRLFSNISKNWRGKPLISYEVIVNLIASTVTSLCKNRVYELSTAKTSNTALLSFLKQSFTKSKLLSFRNFEPTARSS